MPFRRILTSVPAPAPVLVGDATAYVATHQINPPPRARERPANDDELLGLVPKPKRKKSSRRGPPPDTYEVGDRKPPHHTRFKKGQSGNPSGYNGKQRKAKADAEQRSIDDHVLEIFSEPVTVQTPSGAQKMNSIQIALRKLREKAVTGHDRAIKDLLLLYTAAQQRRSVGTTSSAAAFPLTAADDVILAELMDQFRGSTSNDKTPAPDIAASDLPQDDHEVVPCIEEDRL